MKKSIALYSAMLSMLFSASFGTQAPQTNTPFADKDPKSGFFAGIDLSLANFSYSDSGSPISIDSEIRTSFNYGLKGGYQLYFNPRHGVRIGAHLNMGSYNVYDKGTNTTTYTSTPTLEYDNKASYYGLRYGIDVDYLYDFYNAHQTSIGLSAGFGYELANFLGGKITSVTTPITPTAKTPATIRTTKNSLFGTGAYFNLGTHYYFLNHQVELGLRIPLNIFFPINYAANGTTKNVIAGTPYYQYGLIAPLTSVHLSYTYRF
ncbi:hypothetical protein BKH46_08490 [Helicobacter sp. 12S02634-8]|nr:hypothetical protein BKH46_08490 [Helicobacter sp. 12S02634-8]